ncbi:hypothetical protein [Methylobacterium sp. J-068]|uniref:hypothetical protein n=1 Tax=Methylobacterium sp. J-068 TaxID=2836649 RepID=UPI001FBBD8C8|nr:hypothetical protein [Methylobacterium sp. J-068]MCJ2033292.1 hypothetical protein [Methylobacterium sp. J-068]
MNRIPLFPGRASRHRSAALRLRAARRCFDRSTVALRKAALDHIDDQALIGTMLEATLARIAAQGSGPAPR